MRRRINNGYPTFDAYLAYQRSYLAANRERIYARARAWRIKNRERSNALRRLLALRAMRDPLPRHIRKMAKLAAKYPKKRIYYGKS